jgi:uncharacterized protein (TIGR02453 family)
MAEFTGFGKDALGFFSALAFHQDKAWFDENREIYERDVGAPMVALLDDLTAAFARVRIPLKANGKRSMFRIHRDVRFARDKSPYKTHAGAVMTRSGGKDDPGLLYLHISPEGCFAAAGFYRLEPPALLRVRQAIARGNGKAFGAVTAALAKARLALDQESQVSRLPRGFEGHKGGPLDGALRLKSFIVERTLGEKLIRMPKLTETIVGFAEDALPLLKFGWKALG